MTSRLQATQLEKDETSFSCFMTGVADDKLHEHLTLFGPKTIDDALEIAERYRDGRSSREQNKLPSRVTTVQFTPEAKREETPNTARLNSAGLATIASGSERLDGSTLTVMLSSALPILVM